MLSTITPYIPEGDYIDRCMHMYSGITIDYYTYGITGEYTIYGITNLLQVPLCI